MAKLGLAGEEKGLAWICCAGAAGATGDAGLGTDVLNGLAVAKGDAPVADTNGLVTYNDWALIGQSGGTHQRKITYSRIGVGCGWCAW